MVWLITLLVIATALLCFGFVRYRHSFQLAGKTIDLLQPVAMPDNTTKRISACRSEKAKMLIAAEGRLRRAAYSKTTITVDEPFFDDSDMVSSYRLIVVYDKRTNTPLLSARYYFDKEIIEGLIEGTITASNRQAPAQFNEGELFLVDRMSANTASFIYRRHRGYIHLLFFTELLRYNRNCRVLAMARKEKHDKLLKKYLGLGLRVTGSKMHKGREHWVLEGDLEKSYKAFKSARFKTVLLLNKILHS